MKLIKTQGVITAQLADPATSQPPQGHVRVNGKKLNEIWHVTLMPVGDLPQGIGRFFLGKGWTIQDGAYVKPLRPSYIPTIESEIDQFSQTTGIPVDKTYLEQLKQQHQTPAR